MINNIEVKPKGQNMHTNKLIEKLLQSLASIEKNFVYIDQKHYYRKESSWLERPFHFEFYHQLRLKFSNKLKNYVIQAEVEKASHKLGIGNLRPDLIFHIPGEIDGSSQLIHIEVKPVKSNNIKHLNEIINDLQKLSKFKAKLNYDISILVLFGPSNELSETILFIEGDDINDEELNNRRDRVIRDIRSKNQEIFLIVLDVSILI